MNCSSTTKAGKQCSRKAVNSGMCNQHLKCFNKQASIIPTITITFGDAAENHKGMEILGERSDEGLSLIHI